MARPPLNPPPIVRLSGRRCIVVYDWADIDFTDPENPVVLRHGVDCVFTDNGYQLPRRSWFPCVEERLHPWPPFQSI